MIRKFGRFVQNLRELAQTPQHDWRSAFLVALPVPAFALLFGLVLERLGAQATPYDMVAYPALGGVLLVLGVLLHFRIVSFEWAFLGTMSAASLFFLSKFVYILYFLPASANFFRELSETFPWLPALYVLTSLLPHIRGGRRVTSLCLAAMVWLSFMYSAANLWVGQNYGEVEALVQLSLANLTFHALSYFFSRYLGRFVRSQAHIETMERLAYSDLLTGLPNRLALEETLQGTATGFRQNEAEQNEVFALLFIDIDGFKLVNDTLGHEAGDTLLMQIAERLRRATRQIDLLARISGDEFVVLLRELKTGAQGVKVAEKIKKILDEPFFLGAQVFNIGASIGVSVYPDDADSPAALLRHADSAMYHVKHAGKNGVKRYHKAVDAALETHKTIERDLRQALSRGELHLFYQPLFDLRTGRLVKAEALLRWEHPERGWISPADFVPLAEQSGYIVTLGDWVLQTATRQARAWELSGSAVRVSVNVSALQFAQPGFGDSVMEALRRSRLEPGSLELELTESIMLRNPETVRRNLQSLKRSNITVAIDDFGTGYSSLSYLRDFPIDTIKIDRSFVRDLGGPRRAPNYALALIEAIVKLAQNLDVELVAEGIETSEQFKLLRDLGCDVGQGFFFARPMAESEFALLLKQQSLALNMPPRISETLN